jgi:glycosyltransferase involved in cell wall biosynthesis
VIRRAPEIKPNGRFDDTLEDRQTMRLLNIAPAGFRKSEVGDVTRRDVEFAYRFFLGRPVESQAVVKDRLGITVENLASGFINSIEHQSVVAGPLRRGLGLDPDKFSDPPEGDLIAWAADRLPINEQTGVSLRGAETWAQVFGTLATDPWMRKLYENRKANLTIWFRTADAEGGKTYLILSRLIKILNFLPGFGIVLGIFKNSLGLTTEDSGRTLEDLSGRSGPRGKTLNALTSVTEGMRVICAFDIEAVGNGRFTLTTHDPRIQFQFTQTVAKFDVAEITFAVSGARPKAEGRLYIDYSGGFSEEMAISLSPKGRVEYSAFVVSPRQVAKLRWDTDAAPGEVTIKRIVARGLRRADLKAMGGASPTDVDLGDVYEAMAKLGAMTRAIPPSFLMSRLLTQFIGDHGRVSEHAAYQAWIKANELSGEAAIKDRTARLAALKDRPLISILTPTYNTPPGLLQETIESVLAQAYDGWELCIADDASTSPYVRDMLEGYAAADPRIRLAFRPTNGHISAASNTALELATGDWLAMLDHDDLLTPDALLCIAEEINAHPNAILIYSDEDKIDEQGVRSSPFFKPDYSPVLLLAQNYLNHLTVHRAERVRAVGGWRSTYDGSQDFDLNLRVLEGAARDQVRHIPKVLYHWRAVEESTASAADEKSYAIEAARKAVASHIERIGKTASVTRAGNLPFVRVRHALPHPAPLISLIIPTRDQPKVLAVCIDSVLQLSTYPNYEILIADNDSVERETFALFKRLTQDARIRVIPQPGPFNYSAINNAMVAKSRGEVVCLLNNDIEIITPDWMEEMASWALQPQIGCVGAKLYYPDDTIQHAGIVTGIGGVAGHSHKYFPRDSQGYFARISLHHNVSAVTAACLMIRRTVYDEMSGLDPTLKVAFNDVDFCLRVREAGYQNVFTPFAELYHYESISRGAEDNPEKLARFNTEIKIMTERWDDKLSNDPFYSPNLTREREDYSLSL